MCYSKEVSLAVGGTMLLCSAYSWWRFVRPGDAAPDPAPASAAEPRRADLRPFYSAVLLGHLCIAGHQLFEFVAISTGDPVIYKLGLLTSLSCMFFVIRSLERLVDTGFGSRVFLVGLAAVGVDLFLRETTFRNQHFYVRGDAHKTWGIVWMTAFIYWNLAIFRIRRRSPSTANRRLLRAYGLSVLNVSWAAAMVYTYSAGLARHVEPVQSIWDCAGLGDLTAGYQVFGDTPSIWCVFAGAQSLMIPWFFGRMERDYESTALEPPLPDTVGDRLRLAGLAVLACAALYLSYPAIQAVAVKMVTR